MTKKPSNENKSNREKRLQQALRANLARRKIQARARRDGEPGEGVPEPSGATDETLAGAVSPQARAGEAGASPEGEER
ncbi:hypothetical protein [Aurantimonas sp. 22II-16-19i]|uniref:hypothetical protein n=1 Tax=Aurantimonas sp. 22II-16-19i TaxID=1317114 RepID=UPI0009F7CFA8|nr:hypothetical protein [Aurantimonas sp. 22II-16-19i]ORE97378.1 hypothetical protein ATO4_08667 [Aurantimonas sp. 22II-16-19i]